MTGAIGAVIRRTFDGLPHRTGSRKQVVSSLRCGPDLASATITGVGRASQAKKKGHSFRDFG